MNLGGSHDQAQNQAQNQAEGCDPLNRPEDRQGPVSQAIGACIIQISRATQYQARPHHRNAADAHGCNDRSDHDCYGLAAAFGARLSCRCRPQEARAQGLAIVTAESFSVGESQPDAIRVSLGAASSRVELFRALEILATTLKSSAA